MIINDTQKSCLIQNYTIVGSLSGVGVPGLLVTGVTVIEPFGAEAAGLAICCTLLSRGSTLAKAVAAAVSASRCRFSRCSSSA